MTLTVTQALTQRISTRAFLPTPVPEATVRAILDVARWSPSGGNLQPWHVVVLTGEPLAALMADVAQQQQTRPLGDGQEVEIYPKDLKEPYRSRRFRVGEMMYELLGIPREDKLGRLGQMARNFTFFGAPVALFFALDRQMGRNQWAHLGMFMQSIMLAAEEQGLATCAQEAWCLWPNTVRRHTGIGDDLALYCGMALGHADRSAVVNRLRSERDPVDAFATFKGF